MTQQGLADAVDARHAQAETLNTQGNGLSRDGRLAEAMAAYDAAIRIAPDHFAAAFNRARTLLYLGKPTAALAAYEAALALDPQSPQALMGRGHALSILRRWAEAGRAYDAAFASDPEQPFLAGYRLHARMKTCDWAGYEAATADLRARLEAGKPAAAPFSIAALPTSAAQQRACAEAYVGRMHPIARPRPMPPPVERIRVGYFSADFHAHATTYLLAETLELHDREAFEVTAFSFGPSVDDPMRRRVKAACERFYDVRGMNDVDVCNIARGIGLDLAIDLKGFTKDSRPGIFALGAAPVQVNYLGYPMTMGAPFMDYLIADHVLIRPEDTSRYGEKIAWLPHCYQPNDRQRPAPSGESARADHGLPARAFVFAAFNAVYKITPEVFAAWMRLLQALPEAVLWLLCDDPVAMANLRLEAVSARVDPERLILAPEVPLAAHLERLTHADLFLDTHPCNAHTTASDALWAGLPVLTRAGDTFASRVAESLLRAVGLPELVAPDLAAYEVLALELARNPQRLEALRRRLSAARATAPLFDAPAYARALEDLFRRMHERRLAGLAADHIGAAG